MDTTRLSAFAKLLNHHRIAAGLTQEELAERAGVSVRSISDMERGVPHTPRKLTVKLLAVALDLSPADHDAFVAAARNHHTPSALSSSPAASPAVAPSPYLDSLPHNLPIPPTPLIGRESAIAAACDMLRQEDIHLLTLAGPAGVGKTRLGLAVAMRMLEAFGDGVFFVDLAVVSEPDHIPVAIAKALAVNESGLEPLRERLYRYLHTKHMLLLLDNFEHLTQASPEIASMLASCPQLSVLITSRVAVRLRGEYVQIVAPLALPSPAQLSSIELLARVPAVALFAARARQVRVGFALTPKNASTVATICHRLDGLPLAIELAAARVRVLPPQKLLTLLDHRLQILTDGPQDLPVRQQTLRGTLAWSYDLLPEPARALFRRLAIFVGGCTLEAAETVCTAVDDIELSVLDGMTMLVDHSLVHQGERPDGTLSFTMLETLREFGQEQLARCGEGEATARAHAACFLALVEEAQSQLKGPDQARWYALLEQEYGNVRAALRWALESGEAEIGMRLGAALWRFWQNSGHLTEGSSWLEAFLARSGNGAHTEPAPVRATVLIGAGILAQRRGDFARAEELLTQALEMRRNLGDTWGIASSLNNLGGVAYEQDQYARAMRLWQESLALFRDVGDSWATALLLNNLGFVATIRGDCAEALSLYQQSQTLYEASGDVWGMATTLDNQAETERIQGNLERALTLSEKSVRLFREIGAQKGIAHALNTLANIARQNGDYERAETLIEESITILDELKDTSFLAVALTTHGTIACDQHDDAAALDRFKESLLLSRAAGGKRGVPSCLEGLAAVAAHQGQMALAVRLCGAAAALRISLGTPLPLADSPSYQTLLAAARVALDDDRFEVAWRMGSTMPLEEIADVWLDGAFPATATIRC